MRLARIQHLKFVDLQEWRVESSIPTVNANGTANQCSGCKPTKQPFPNQERLTENARNETGFILKNKILGPEESRFQPSRKRSFHDHILRIDGRNIHLG